MPVLELAAGLERVRASLLAAEHLARAVATGRRRGASAPDLAAGEAERVELRVVDLARGSALQVTSRSGPVVRTANHALADPAALAVAVDDLLAVPFAHWHVETAAATLQLRVTKRGQAQVATSRAPAPPHAEPAAGGAAPRPHDRAKRTLLDPDDPLFTVLGADGAKRRQVEAFVRQLATAVDGLAPRDASGRPRALRVVDLGCGNAYLTFAAHRWLSGRPGGARTVGVELRADLVARAGQRAADAGLDGLTFTAGAIADADPSDELGGPPDVVLALHACDTATDDALARAVRWAAPVVLAAPCCHRDVQRQIAAATRAGTDLGAGAALVRSPILRERFADVLTDALRADVLRALGRRVDVVEFVDSAHTPRNALLRIAAPAAGTDPAGARAAGEAASARAELAALSAAWGVTPVLAQRLAPELAATST